MRLYKIFVELTMASGGKENLHYAQCPLKEDFSKLVNNLKSQSTLGSESIFFQNCENKRKNLQKN